MKQDSELKRESSHFGSWLKNFTQGNISSVPFTSIGFNIDYLLMSSAPSPHQPTTSSAFSIITPYSSEPSPKT